jgi:hypothetical protein
MHDMRGTVRYAMTTCLYLGAGAQAPLTPCQCASPATSLPQPAPGCHTQHCGGEPRAFSLTQCTLHSKTLWDRIAYKPQRNILPQGWGHSHCVGVVLYCPDNQWLLQESTCSLCSQEMP